MFLWSAIDEAGDSRPSATEAEGGTPLCLPDAAGPPACEAASTAPASTPPRPDGRAERSAPSLDGAGARRVGSLVVGMIEETGTTVATVWTLAPPQPPGAVGQAEQDEAAVLEAPRGGKAEVERPRRLGQRLRRPAVQAGPEREQAAHPRRERLEALRHPRHVPGDRVLHGRRLSGRRDGPPRRGAPSGA